MRDRAVTSRTHACVVWERVRELLEALWPSFSFQTRLKSSYSASGMSLGSAPEMAGALWLASCIHAACILGMTSKYPDSCVYSGLGR